MIFDDDLWVPRPSVSTIRHAPDRDNHPVRLLIVDDEPAVCRVLVMAFARAGYAPVSAQSGEGALAILQSIPIDVMLLDLLIPDMRGDAIFAFACGAQPHLRGRTLFMTGAITDRAYRSISGCRCNFIRKPFNLESMLQAIHALSHQTPVRQIRGVSERDR